MESESLKQVADELKVNESTIRKYIVSKGFKRIGNEFVLKDDTCNHREHTLEKQEITKENTDVINLPDLRTNMVYLSDEIETLKNIIKWFKNKDDISNTDVIELRTGILIELPKAEIKRTTVRINSKVWDMFNELVEEYKPIDKHDLMSMALLEYVNKYSKKKNI
jgi:hypothetical protein